MSVDDSVMPVASVGGSSDGLLGRGGEVVLPDPVTGRGQWVPVTAVRELEALLEAARTATAEAEADAENAREVLEQERRVDAERNDAACEWAERNDLCSQFEAFCETHGWHGRDRDFATTVRVTVDVPLTLRARASSDADDLREMVSESVVLERVRGGGYSLVSLDVEDYSI